MNLPSIIVEVYKALGSLFVWARLRRQRILNLLTVVTAVTVFWQTWFAYNQKQLVFIGGVPGSTINSIGPKLVEEISRTRDPSGVTYKITMESAPENLGIRERMAYETSRLPLGIIEDGLPVDNRLGDDLRALIPMEWDYLFVIASRKFLIQIDKETALTLEDVFSDFKKKTRPDGRQFKVFLGPEATISNKMSQLALKKLGLPPEEQFARGIADWREMKVAFRTGDLDLAFYVGPIGAELLESIAQDGNVVLLGLGDITEAIQHENGFQFLDAKLPQNLFVAKLHQSEKSAAEDFEAPVAFCRSDLRTIASRRVLACPRSLSEADAYLLASVSQGVLVEHGYRINLNADDVPYGHNRDSGFTGGLRMPLHPGAELLMKRSKPVVWRDWTTWPGWLQAVLSILAGLLALDGLRLLTAFIDRTTKAAASPPDAGTIPLPPSDYAKLDQMLTEYETAVDEKTHRQIASEMTTWDDRLRDLRQALRKGRELTDTEREALRKRYDALAWEVEGSTRWVTKRRTASSKSTPPPAAPATLPEPPVESEDG